MELSLNHLEEEESTIAVVFIFIFGFVGVVLLIEVILWQVSVLLFSDLRQICFAIFVNIGINVHRHGASMILLTSEPFQI